MGMRRRNLHVGFAALALACVAVTGLQWLELERGQSINGYLARPGTASESEVPIVLLANANALSAGNDLAAASEGYADLIREQAGQPVGQAALFNLGNAYLREALRRAPRPTGSAPSPSRSDGRVGNGRSG